MPLPKPIGRQREVLALPAEGHTVVLGTAGSGKTTLAILRAALLSDAATEHYGRTLLVSAAQRPKGGRTPAESYPVWVCTEGA
jgi:hypothetical protein